VTVRPQGFVLCLPQSIPVAVLQSHTERAELGLRAAAIITSQVALVWQAVGSTSASLPGQFYTSPIITLLIPLVLSCVSVECPKLLNVSPVGLHYMKRANLLLLFGLESYCPLQVAWVGLPDSQSGIPRQLGARQL